MQWFKHLLSAYFWLLPFGYVVILIQRVQGSAVLIESLELEACRALRVLLKRLRIFEDELETVLGHIFAKCVDQQLLQMSFISFIKCPVSVEDLNLFCESGETESAVLYICPAQSVNHLESHACITKGRPRLLYENGSLVSPNAEDTAVLAPSRASAQVKFHDLPANKTHPLALLRSIEPKGEQELSDLYGKRLRIAAVKSQLYDFDTNIRRTLDGKWVLKESFTTELLEALQFNMNFTYKLVVTDAWGYYNKNTSSWDGMVAALMDGEADLALSSTSDVPARRKVVDFNMPTTQLKLSAFFIPPQPTANVGALLHPFQLDVWIAILVWLILFTAVLAVFTRITTRFNSQERAIFKPAMEEVESWGESINISVKSTKNNDLNQKSDDSGSKSSMAVPSVAECFVLAIASVCSRGYYWFPQHDGHRAVVCFAYVTGLFLMAAYGGTLFSFLSIVQDTVKTYEALMGTKFRFILANNDRLLHSRLQESPFQIHVDTFKRADLRRGYWDLAEAKRELLKGSLAFFTTDVSAYHIIGNNFTSGESCSVREINVPFVPVQNQGTMVPKRSPLRRVIDYNILQMTETGLVDRWRRRFIPGKQRKCAETVSFSGVEMKSVSVAFGIISLGGVMSFLILIVELKPLRRLQYHR